MKLLVDMNLSPKWARFLAAAGYEAVHWSVLGAGNAPDSEIMACAREGNFVVLTCDLDFGAILAITQGEKPSVVQLRVDNLAWDVIGKRVVDALRQVRDELDSGALVTIEPERMRMRILPLKTTTRE